MSTDQQALVLDVFPATSLSFFSFALQEYDEHVEKLRLAVDDMDRRLSAIFCQALEDAPGLEHILKVQAVVVSACLSPAYKGILLNDVVLSNVCSSWICLVACWNTPDWLEMFNSNILDSCPCLTKSWISANVYMTSTLKQQRSRVRDLNSIFKHSWLESHRCYGLTAAIVKG